ncbi:GNAT family N-acetyltransferase [Candidatus Nitrosocosmicus franklandus]|uniref:Acetyltransferase (GNAT) family protein n=1 Tax=Candidatus Nitrosocosmicus franklandianus TaxID=1798806 RepID=A0A484ICI0_9ARCH|nr:GNAT family N-acetyltransferase [Candidatus Nitrosocosmicus franklandus]VFJ12721.1 Acetyltransferase (GNAT) family protein [Candidatus Nitrosocosmicus franklandus]
MSSFYVLNSDSVIVRRTVKKDIPAIVKLQEESFADLAKIGNIWHPDELRSHLEIFPEGQLVAELDGEIVGSATSLIVDLVPEYANHTWKDITADGMLTTHTYKGDSLYGADISTHPKVRHKGIGHKLYQGRKDVTMKFNLKRMIAGGRLYNYCDYANEFTPLEYALKVVRCEIHDLVLSFDLINGFRFIKILTNYLEDARSLNYASFIEWKNPHFNTASIS